MEKVEPQATKREVQNHENPLKIGEKGRAEKAIKKNMEKVDFFDTPAPPDRGYFLGASRDEPKTPVSKQSQKMTSKMMPKSIANP